MSSTTIITVENNYNNGKRFLFKKSINYIVMSSEGIYQNKCNYIHTHTHIQTIQANTNSTTSYVSIDFEISGVFDLSRDS